MRSRKKRHLHRRLIENRRRGGKRPPTQRGGKAFRHVVNRTAVPVEVISPSQPSDIEVPPGRAVLIIIEPSTA